MPGSVNDTVVSTAVGSAITAPPGPEVCAHSTPTVAGGSGRPSSETVPSKVASSPNTTDVEDADTTGGVFGTGPPVTYSICNNGAFEGDPLYDSAVRSPDPVITNTNGLPETQPP